MYFCFKMLNSPTSRKGLPWHYWFAKSKTPEQPREQNSTTCDFGKLHVKQHNKKRKRVITIKRSNQPCLNENHKHHLNPNLLNKYSHWSLVTLLHLYFPSIPFPSPLTPKRWCCFGRSASRARPKLIAQGKGFPRALQGWSLGSKQMAQILKGRLTKFLVLNSTNM